MCEVDFCDNHPPISVRIMAKRFLGSRLCFTILAAAHPFCSVASKCWRGKYKEGWGCEAVRLGAQMLAHPDSHVRLIFPQKCQVLPAGAAAVRQDTVLPTVGYANPDRLLVAGGKCLSKFTQAPFTFKWEKELDVRVSLKHTKKWE